VPTSVLHDLFAGPTGIRVRIDWDEVLRRELPVSARFVSAFAAFDGSYLPWYVPPVGAEADFDDDARPVSLAEFPQIERRLRPERREKIAQLRRDMRKSKGVQLLVPAYDLGDGRHLLLDACHRVAALADAPVPLAAVILVLHGPLDVRVLPDLSHWVGLRAP
jgi:hypothetical protein